MDTVGIEPTQCSDRDSGDPASTGHRRVGARQRARAV